LPVVASYGLIYHSHIIYNSDRFGGNQTILGVLFFAALLAAIDLGA
jgi:hypothetical protein